MDESSILDKVLSSKQSTDIQNFNPTETLSALFRHLTSKEQDIVRSRYGLNGKNKETLEEIGKRYKVTRERIRQIEGSAVQKMKQLKDFATITASTEGLIRQILETHGSVMTEDGLLRELFRASGSSESNRRLVLFLLLELLRDKFDRVTAGDGLRVGWKLKAASLSIVRETTGQILHVIQRLEKPVTVEDLFEQLKGSEYFLQHAERLSEEVLTSYMELSEEIARNPYGEYGLTKWGTIVPRRMNDKIYLVLKKHGKPMHFNEITRLINETGFDHRKAYPPTVHNELILNKQYVLVGRGIYALGEWGYKPGVVADVLQDILRTANAAMSRDELVHKVLEQRMVKKNTVYLALADRTRFEKLADGRYQLAARSDKI